MAIQNRGGSAQVLMLLETICHAGGAVWHLSGRDTLNAGQEGAEMQVAEFLTVMLDVFPLL